MNNIEILEAIKLAKTKAYELRKEICDTCDAVGADTSFQFVSNSITYDISISAYWEKFSHFDMSISSEQNDFKYHGGCIGF